MKKKYSLLILMIIFLFSCENNFLDRYPLDQITVQSYWKSVNDLELYLNQFYTNFPGFTIGSQDAGIFVIDNNSDNMIPVQFNSTLGGTRTVPSNGGGWNWNNIRAINIFLENYHKCEAPEEQYLPFVGEAQFFKAYFYFNLLSTFGDVPWYTNSLQTDSEELYAPRTPRNIVVDSILHLLDKAAEYLPEKKRATPFRVNKESALLFKSRVALFEGTWEKYHDNSVFGVLNSDPVKYLKQAEEAANALIQMGTCEVYSSGDHSSDYINLFNRNDYSTISEIILWKKFDFSLSMGHSVYLTTYNGHGTGLSKSLVEDYLCVDGKPIALSSYYMGDESYITATQNRDSRLSQTLFMPGDVVTIRDGAVLATFEKPDLFETAFYVNTTGYQIEKGHRPVKYTSADFNDSDNASIIFRYAEALLNYAEAKSELGTINQQDLDLTVNLLRRRVGMPDMILEQISNWSDPNWSFPSLSPIINEIRRERRIELACEGYRNNDLRRWRAHSLIVGIKPMGAKFIHQDYPEIVIGKDIYVEENGYIDPYQKSLPNGWQFNPERDYLSPLPSDELTLNENLEQNPGW
ncbi:MAG: SusD-like protein P2 [Petrimonas sp.]|uniref:RagB/SusD family nutrient uptake outer membrane protein n=1 Tax=Petrimonas sp. TaxID=2023866 RepID=UPI0030D3357B